VRGRITDLPQGDFYEHTIFLFFLSLGLLADTIRLLHSMPQICTWIAVSAKRRDFMAESSLPLCSVFSCVSGLVYKMDRSVRLEDTL
jgi:hypothetical protein